jgi:hypothetical protein
MMSIFHLFVGWSLSDDLSGALAAPTLTSLPQLKPKF